MKHKKNRLILRPRYWRATFIISTVLLLGCVIYSVYVLLVDSFYDELNPYFKPLLGILLCLCGMALSTEKVVVTDKRIIVEKFFFFKNTILIDDIEQVEIGYKSGRPRHGFGFIRYKGIDIYSKGKKYGDISEQWFYYDDLIKFFEEKNIPMKLEEGQ